MMQYTHKYRLVFKSYDRKLYMDIKGKLTEREEEAITIHNKRDAANVMREFVVDHRESSTGIHITEYSIEEVS